MSGHTRWREIKHRKTLRSYSDDELVKAFMLTYGCTEAGAKRLLAIQKGEWEPDLKGVDLEGPSWLADEPE